jgi:hypothetical protein
MKRDLKKYDILASRWRTAAELDLLVVWVPLDEFDHPLAMTVHRTVLDRTDTPYVILSEREGNVVVNTPFDRIWKYETGKRGLDIKSLRFHPIQVEAEVCPRDVLGEPKE